MKTLISAAVSVMLVTISAFCGEATNEVRTAIVKMMCGTPKCKGEMNPTGSVLTSMPPQYPHQCAVCKTNRIYLTAYPEIRYEVKETQPPAPDGFLILTNTINATWITRSEFTISHWLTATSDENWSPTNTVFISTLKPIVVKTNGEWRITFELKR